MDRITNPHKNELTSYGLTLVAGLPLSLEISTNLENIRAIVEKNQSEKILWYGPEHLHVTLAAPLRGRYREQPPLQRKELPANFNDFIQDISCFFGRLKPFRLSISNPHFTADGTLITSVVSSIPIHQQLVDLLEKYPELDPPKKEHILHLTLGHIKSSTIMRSSHQPEISYSSFASLLQQFIGEEVVERIWFVHYSNRTLNKIVGRFALPIGQTEGIESVLTDLGIDDDKSLLL